MYERIKQVRKSLGLTQQEFGSRIGIKKASISTIESGKSNPSAQTLLSICREFGVCEEWLRDGTGEMFQEQANATACSSINERIRYLRKNVLKLNQRQFAADLGMAQTGISTVERPDGPVTNRTIKIICFTYNVQDEWLRNGTGEIFQNQANAAVCSSINERIQYVRQLLNLTLEEFGKRIGVTKSAISRLENSSRGITNQMAISICREFDICEDWLRNGTGEIFQNQANAAVCSSINERIRYLRNDVLQLNQRQFADAIGMAQRGISDVEKDNGSVTERTIKIICLTYNVREEWLRNGTGEIFTPDSTLSPMETSLLSDFRALDIRGQAKVLDYIQDLMQAAAYRSSIYQPK